MDFKVENIGRYLMLAGAGLFLIGALIVLINKFGIPIGRLPGDIYIEGQNGSFYFPVTTSILVSIVLTILANLISRFWPK